MKFVDLKGKNVAILGMGREGKNVLAALRSRLPAQVVTLVDESNEEPSPLDEFRNDPFLKFIQGELTSAELAGFDVLIKSPGVSLYRSDLQKASKKGLKITSLTNLWLAENRASQTIVVTGTKGKSTTASLLEKILAPLGKKVLLRGNVGRALFDQQDSEVDADYVVIELSSYQLADLEEKVDYALITNLAPEHLDWHQGLENYYRDKLNGLKCARVVFVNGADDELVERLQSHKNCRWFGGQAPLAWDDRGVLLEGEVIINRDKILLRGLHNVANITAALSVAVELGVLVDDAKSVVSQFSSLSHRLEIVAEKKGRVFVDDSIASTPLATLAALRSWGSRPIALIVGGADRGLPMDAFVAAILDDPHCYQVEAMGAFGARFVSEYEIKQRDLGHGPPVHLNDDLEGAMRACWKYSREAGVVLLSPGAPSFDEFRDFAHRGDYFQELAHQLGVSGEILGE